MEREEGWRGRGDGEGGGMEREGGWRGRGDGEGGGRERRQKENFHHETVITSR